MIGYVTLGSNDLAKGGAFYDAVLGVLGAKRFMENDRMVIWGTDPTKPMLAICTPFDEQSATAGNGVMVALRVEEPGLADRIHAKAMELGGVDEGAPGLRGDNFYGAYFRDLDGNKLVAFKMG